MFLLRHRCEKLVVEPLLLRAFHICIMWWRQKYLSGVQDEIPSMSEILICINAQINTCCTSNCFIFLQRCLISKGSSVYTASVKCMRLIPFTIWSWPLYESKPGCLTYIPLGDEMRSVQDHHEQSWCWTARQLRM